MNSSNGTLGGSDLYQILRDFIKGCAFVNIEDWGIQ
jgi:hypothetical protein